MNKILAFVFLSFFIISCSNEQGASKGDGDAPSTVNVTDSDSVLNLDNNTYSKSVSLQIAEQNDKPITITLCFMQNPTGPVVRESGPVTPTEYERMGFQVQGCTSVDHLFTETSASLNFNVLEAIKNLEGIQNIYGEVYTSLVVDGDTQKIWMLGKEVIEKPAPQVEPVYGLHASTDIDEKSTWSIKDNIYPTDIYTTAEIDLKLKGEPADIIKIYAGSNGSSSSSTAQVKDLDGSNLGNITYTLETTEIDPTQINANIEDINENVLETVNFQNHSTTDAKVLPEVTTTIKVRFSFDSLKQFLQTVATNGTGSTYLKPSDKYTNEVPVTFTIVAEKDGVAYPAKTITVDFGDLIYDIRDYHESVFTSEYLSGHAVAANTPTFSPLKYEAPKNMRSGNNKFNVNANMKAGLYIEEVKIKDEQTGLEKTRQQMRSRIDADAQLTLLSKGVNAFNGYVEAVGVPNSNLNSNDGSGNINVQLSLLGKQVVNTSLKVGQTRFEFKNDFTYENNFEQSDTMTFVVPFYYRVGGRGSIGFEPHVIVSFVKGTFQNTGEVTELTQEKNPVTKPAQQVKEAEALPDVGRFVHEYIYTTLPTWAQTFVTQQNLVKDGNIVRDYNNQLLVEYKKRVRHNSAINGYQEQIQALTTHMKTVSDQPYGVQVQYTARPHVELSGYGAGGIGIAKDWKFLRVGIGFGIEASMNPIIYANLPVTLGGFAGIGNSTLDGNNYLYLNYNFKAPLTYQLLKGKVWAGFDIKLQVKIIKWINIINSKFGPTLFDATNQNPITIDLVQPINKNHLIQIKGNTQ